MTIKKPQANYLLEQVHQVIFNMLVTKDIDKQVLDYIEPWGKKLVYIAWAISDSYHHTIGTTPDQSGFGRDMIINLTSVLDWKFRTSRKQRNANSVNVSRKCQTVYI